MEPKWERYKVGDIVQLNVSELHDAQIGLFGKFGILPGKEYIVGEVFTPSNVLWHVHLIGPDIHGSGNFPAYMFKLKRISNAERVAMRMKELATK